MIEQNIHMVLLTEEVLQFVRGELLTSWNAYGHKGKQKEQITARIALDAFNQALKGNKKPL